MAGFSMIEALVASLLSLLLIGAIAPLLGSHSIVAATAPEMVDEQQRGRLGADVLFHDLSMAGAGPSVGPHAGTLLRNFAPVMPRKVGLTGDAFNVARPDAISVAYVPQTSTQSVLLQAMAGATDPMQVDTSIGCPRGTQVCGFQQGSTALLFDAAGRFDLVGILSLQAAANSATIEHRQQGAVSFAYAAGASVTEAESHTYYFDRPNQLLRHSDGAHSDVPLIDNVVSVAFEYFGDPSPPVMPKPPIGIANCLYDVAGNAVSGMTTMGSGGAAVVALPISMFTDGPWCAAGSNRYDADLLRVRLIRVTLRLAVANTMLRGTTSDFAVTGKGRSALRQVPDYTIRFDVAPRSMASGPQR